MRESHKEVGVRERESHNEAGEEPAKVGWIRGKNGRERLTKRADALRVSTRKLV